MQITVIIGSLREKSYNRAVFNTLKELAPEGVVFVEAPIHDLPLLNTDREDPLPSTVADLKEAIESADGVILMTPEYNRSISGALKNAIDWATRPEGKNSWTGKPVTVMGATPGRLGTAPAQMHLKGILVYLGTKPMGQPEAYIGGAADLISEDGLTIQDEGMRERLGKFLEAFIRHIKG
ncbi:MAG: NADPH-dependent FMN reductase [Candidatus Paceibacteria bacterium]